jgi:hypothetical protein
VAERLFAESGMVSAHDPIDVGLVSSLLGEHYDLSGRLHSLATERTTRSGSRPTRPDTS